jgi:hypothetical protein
MRRRALLVVVLGLALLAAAPADYTKTDPKSLGIEPVKPTRDKKTGFVVGGKNPTALVRKLKEIAGRSIADLEEDMRPGALSGKGFLGEDERLLDIMAGDNAFVVDMLGLTHQELARHLQLLGAVAEKHANIDPLVVLYHGKRFRVRAILWKGFQKSPFKDGTETNCDVTVENLGNGKKIGYSLLVPLMIERYGFYEGKGTTYRVEPARVLEVFDFIKGVSRKGG